MSTRISNLKDSSNNTVYPVTKVECVYNDNNQNVGEIINALGVTLTQLWEGNISGLPEVTLSQNMTNFRWLWVYVIVDDGYRFGQYIPAQWFRGSCNSSSTRIVLSTDVSYCGIYASAVNKIKVYDRHNKAVSLVVLGVN